MRGLFHGVIYLVKALVAGLVLAFLFSPFVVFGEGDLSDFVPFYQALFSIASVVLLFNQVHVLVTGRIEQELPDEGEEKGEDSELPQAVVDTASPTAVVKTYFDLIDSTSPPTDAFERLLHSDAVLAVDEFDPGESPPFEGVALRQLIIRVESEDLDRAAVEAELEEVHVRGEPDEETVEAVAGRNAIVDVDVTLEGTTFEPRQFLVAPQDGNEGDWRIVSVR
jgi:ketosteroid isomerase-like protein